MSEIEITSAQYVDSTNTVVKATVDGTEMFVPPDPANRHFVAVTAWAEEDGNTIQEAEE